MSGLPRWALLTILALCAFLFVATIVVSAASGWITDWLLDRIGFWPLLATCLVGTGILIWIGSRLDDD